jgi:mannose-6-phosphate isomerase-like protein (cupin superfamily)
MKHFTQLKSIPSVLKSEEHGGLGPIEFRRLWTSQDFLAPIDFIDFTVIPPGSTIGAHGHENNEEAYFVAEGSPLMQIQGEVLRLGKGDIAVVHSGESHELINDSMTDVEILVIQVRFEATVDTFSRKAQN